MRDDLLAALADAVSHAEGGVPVERHETHGARGSSWPQTGR